MSKMKRFGRKAHNFIMREPQYDKRYTWLIGSVRSSKTFALDAKTIVQLCRYKVEGKRFMTGATKQTLYRNVLLDLFEIAGKNNYHYNSSSGELWLWDSQWFVIGAKDEASYKTILGSTVGVWVGDEIVEYPKSFIAQMFMRMSPEGARAYGSTNPGNPYCYFKTDVLDEFTGDQQEVIQFTLDDNPNLSPAVKSAIVASQKGVFKLRYIDGLWVVAEGAIYRDSWNDKENLFEEPPATLLNAGGHIDHWYSVDAGVDHPQVHLEFYDDGDVVWVTREQVWDSREMMRQKTDGEYSADMRQFQGGEPRYQVILPPEAASLRAQFVMDGFWITDADNSVEDGIHTVSTLLGRRKLKISRRGCPRLAKRVPTYAWNEKSSERGKEEPVKSVGGVSVDDECDALRYGVHGKIPLWRVTGV